MPPPPAKRSGKKTSTELSPPADGLWKKIWQKLAEQTDSFQNHTAELENRITTKITLTLDGINSDMSELMKRVERLESEVAEIRALRDQVNRLKSASELQKNERVACYLRLHGVPFNQGKDVRALFNTNCLNLKVTPTPRIRDIFRMEPPRNGNSIVDPIIMIKFDKPEDKTWRQPDAYRGSTTAWNEKPACLSYVGIDSPTPIYLNEQLTKTNF